MKKIIYNVTIKIDKAIENEWLEWMQSKHIPDVMKTQCFETYTLSSVRGDEDEHGVTFSIQYLAPDSETLQRYFDEHASDLQKEHSEKYKGRFGAFRTMLNVIKQFNN